MRMLHGLWAEPNHQKGFVKYQKYIVIHQKTNPLFSNAGKSVWGFCGLPPCFQKSFHKTERRTRLGRMKLPIRMIIWHSCCFWLCSVIIRNKLTWKYIRLVNLSPPPHLPKLPHPPTITPPPLPSSPPKQAAPLPSCIRPFSVTILYFDGSQRKKGSDKETERLGLLWLSDRGPRFSLVPLLPFVLWLLPVASYPLVFSLIFPSTIISPPFIKAFFSLPQLLLCDSPPLLARYCLNVSNPLGNTIRLLDRGARVKVSQVWPLHTASLI